MTDKDCIHPDISILPEVAGCKNVQKLDGTRYQCLNTCEKGYYNVTQTPVLGWWYKFESKGYLIDRQTVESLNFECYNLFSRLSITENLRLSLKLDYPCFEG